MKLGMPGTPGTLAPGHFGLKGAKGQPTIPVPPPVGAGLVVMLKPSVLVQHQEHPGTQRAVWMPANRWQHGSEVHAHHPTSTSNKPSSVALGTFSISMSRQSVKSREKLGSSDWRCSLALSSVYAFISDTFVMTFLWLPGR